MSTQNDSSGLNSGPGVQDYNEPMSGTSRDTRGSIKQKARETKEQVINKGNEALHQAQEKTRAFAEDRKHHLGDRIHGYGSAVRRAAEKLRDEEDPNIAHYADMVAERLDQVGDYFQSRDPGAILRDVENAARRRPEIFFGGMFLAGLMLSRFLKASNQRVEGYEYESEYESSDDDSDYWVEEPYAGDMGYDTTNTPQSKMNTDFTAGGGNSGQGSNPPGGSI